MADMYELKRGSARVEKENTKIKVASYQEKIEKAISDTGNWNWSDAIRVCKDCECHVFLNFDSQLDWKRQIVQELEKVSDSICQTQPK